MARAASRGALAREKLRTEPALERRISVQGFSRDDERLLTMLCAHCSIFLRHLDA